MKNARLAIPVLGIAFLLIAAAGHVSGTSQLTLAPNRGAGFADPTAPVADPSAGLATPIPSAGATTPVARLEGSRGGCVSVPEITDTDHYIKLRQMRGVPPDQPLIPADSLGLAAGAAPRTDGLVAMSFEGSGSLQFLGAFEVPWYPLAVAHYGSPDLSTSTMFTGFIVAGGVIVRQAPAAGMDAERVAEEIGPRAQIVQVGPYKAILALGDEIATGARGLGIYWSDGERDWAVMASLTHVDPLDLLKFARSLYCD